MSGCAGAGNAWLPGMVALVTHLVVAGVGEQRLYGPGLFVTVFEQQVATGGQAWQGRRGEFTQVGEAVVVGNQGTAWLET